MPPQPLRIMTYNILEPRLAEEWNVPQGLTPTGHSNWTQRSRQISENIAAARPDILLLQEVSPTAQPPLPEGMELSPLSLHPGAYPTAPYGCAIAFNTQRLRGSFGTLINESQTRAACEGGLWDREMEQMYFAVSTHLKGYTEGHQVPTALWAQKQPGNRDLERQLHHLDQYTGHALAIVGGDFNMDPQADDDRHLLMQKYNYVTSARRVVTEPATGRQIDFIYVLGCEAGQIEEPEIKWPHPSASDHLPRLMIVQP